MQSPRSSLTLRSASPGLRWTRRATVRVAAVAIASIAVLGLTGCSRSDETSARHECQANLQQLAGLFAAVQAAAAPGWVPPSGPALFLGWRAEGRKIRAGQESVLICGNDPLARAPETPEERAAYDTVDLTKPPRALCSYAVRDFATFPLTPGGATPEPIAACIHHGETFTARGGVNVAYSDGSARFLGYEELGVSSSDDVTVGPASKAPLLRTLIYGDGSVK